MRQEIQTVNALDREGRPAGGHVHGIGLEIRWQNGPLGTGDNRKEPNGCFVETVIAAARQRLEHYQDSPFACDANATAIESLNIALEALDLGTTDRERRGVEGTHEP